MAAAGPARLVTTQGVVRPNTGEREVAGSTATAGSKDGALPCGGGGEPVHAGDVDASITSPCAGAARGASATSIQKRCHTRAPCGFVLENRRNMASLERERQAVVVEVCGN